MKHASLTVEKREITGNKVRKLRRDEVLPGVVYGNKIENTCIQLSKNQFMKIYRDAGNTHVIELNLGKDTIPVLVHELDVHPVKSDVRHVDFLAVDLKKKVTTEVPVEYIGKPEGISTIGALLNTTKDTLNVEALPDKIPEVITINVEGLADLSDHIKISDIEKSDDYIILDDPEETIANLVMPVEEVEEEPVAIEDIEGAGDSSEEGEEGKAGDGETKEEKKEE